MNKTPITPILFGMGAALFAAWTTLCATGYALRSPAAEYNMLRTTAQVIQQDNSNDRESLQDKVMYAKNALHAIAKNQELNVKELPSIENDIAKIESELKTSKFPEIYAPAIKEEGKKMQTVAEDYGRGDNYTKFPIILGYLVAGAAAVMACVTAKNMKK